MKIKTKRKIGRVILYLLVLIIVVCTFAPYLWLIISSFSTKAELLDRMIFLIPDKPTLINYQNLMSRDFIPAAKNSIVVTATVVLISLVIKI